MLHQVCQDSSEFAAISFIGIEMDANELEHVARQAYDAIFNNIDSIEVDGMVYELERTSRGRLRKFSVRGLTFMEQNPNKDSRWAEMARDGSQIMWVMQGRQYLARVMDGKYLKLRG